MKIVIAVLFFFVCSQMAFARVLGVDVKPSVSVSQMYSDNLRYQNSSTVGNGTQPLGGFVTQIAPDLSLSRKSSRLDFNLNARLQYLYYEGVDIDPRLYPQLQMGTHAELYDDSLFLDSSSTVGQGNGSSVGGFNPTNVSVPTNSNSTTYRNVRISPYWKPHLRGYAEGEVRVGYIRFDNSNSNNGIGTSQTTGSIPNLASDSFQESVYFQNGKEFDSTGMTWRMNFNNQQQNRQGSSSTISTSNIRFRAVNGEVSYKLINDISAFVQTGYYDNAYSGTATPNNGFYMTPGVSWLPSPHFSLSAGYGINAYFSTLTWHPSQQTYLQVSFRDSKVGGSNCGNSLLPGSNIGGSTSTSAGSLSNQSCSTSSGYGVNGGGMGTGFSSYGNGSQISSNFPTGALGASNSGAVWNASLNHLTKQSSWTASYFTTTTTIQQLLTDVSTFTTPTDLQGNPTSDALANERNISLPNLTDGVIISKRAQLSVAWFLSRSHFNLSAYQANYTYSTATARNQDMIGVNANWTLFFNPRTSAMFTGYWQNSEYQNNNQISNPGRTNFLSVSVGLTRHITEFISTSLNYSYYQNDTSTATLGNSIGSFDANRVTANVFVRF